MKDCPACAKQIADDVKSCPFCQSVLVKTCPYCAEEIQSEAIFCRFCKTNLAGPAAGVGRIDPAEADRIRGQIRGQNLISFAFGIPGLVLQFAGNGMLRATEGARHAADSAALGSLLVLVGSVLLIIGLSFYAKMKGRNGAWGLMGLLSCIGLLVLALIGKACHRCQTMAGRSATQCTKCGAPM